MTQNDATKLIFITAPTGPDGRDEVSVNVDEIASYRSHVVTSYSYQEWTLVSLKNGIQHDCRITKAEFEKRLRVAAETAATLYRASLPPHVSTEAVWDNFTGQAVVNLGMTPWGHCPEHEVHQSWCEPCKAAKDSVTLGPRATPPGCHGHTHDGPCPEPPTDAGPWGEAAEYGGTIPTTGADQ